MVVVSVPVKLGSNGVFKPEIFVPLKTLWGLLTCWDIVPVLHFLITLLLACLWFWHIPFPNHRDIHDYLRIFFHFISKFQFETFHFFVKGGNFVEMCRKGQFPTICTVGSLAERVCLVSRAEPSKSGSKCDDRLEHWTARIISFFLHKTPKGTWTVVVYIKIHCNALIGITIHITSA